MVYKYLLAAANCSDFSLYLYSIQLSGLIIMYLPIFASSYLHEVDGNLVDIFLACVAQRLLKTAKPLKQVAN